MAGRVNTRVVDEARERRLRAQAAGRTLRRAVRVRAPERRADARPARARAGRSEPTVSRCRKAERRPASAGAPAGRQGAARPRLAPRAERGACASGGAGAAGARGAAGAAAARAAAAGAAADVRVVRAARAGQGSRHRRNQQPDQDADDDDTEVVVAGLVGGGGGGLTPLIFAAREGDLESARALLDAGANVNQPSEYGWTPLLTAVNNRNYQLAQAADRTRRRRQPRQQGRVDAAVPGDRQPQHRGRRLSGARRRTWTISSSFRLLLEKGANPNARIKDNTLTRTIFTMQWFLEDGATPFIRAAQSSDTALMKLLLKYKADPKIATNFGDTALTAAGGIGWVPGVTYERSAKENVEAIRMLLDLGLDPERRQQRRPDGADGRGDEGSQRRRAAARRARRRPGAEGQRQPRHRQGDIRRPPATAGRRSTTPTASCASACSRPSSIPRRQRSFAS